MDDNFSPRVKDVIAYSKEEALRLGHDFIGTEHLMLGLLRDGNGKAIDILGALEIDFNVTDTFHLTILKGQIRSIKTSSNDPDLFYEAKEWVKQNRPELIEEPCEGIWEGGPTACECVKAMVEGFAEFKVNNPAKL